MDATPVPWASTLITKPAISDPLVAADDAHDFNSLSEPFVVRSMRSSLWPVVVEDRQLELAEALGVGEQVDSDDPPTPDLEGQHQPEASVVEPRRLPLRHSPAPAARSGRAPRRRRPTSPRSLHRGSPSVRPEAVLRGRGGGCPARGTGAWQSGRPGARRGRATGVRDGRPAPRIPASPSQAPRVRAGSVPRQGRSRGPGWREPRARPGCGSPNLGGLPCRPGELAGRRQIRPRVVRCSSAVVSARTAPEPNRAALHRRPWTPCKGPLGATVSPRSSTADQGRTFVQD